jgi:acetyl esterase/lipase
VRTLTAALTILAKRFEFADGPFLTAKGMAWFWDAYCPDEAQRSEITVSPLRASLDQLAGLPRRS